MSKTNGIVISKSDILSAVAYCAIRQSPYDYPPNLTEALSALSKKIDDEGIFTSTGKQSAGSYRILDSSDKLFNIINKLVKETPEISIWNVSKVEIDAGVTSADDPKRTVEFLATSRYADVKPEYDFIDLDALSRNVCNLMYSQEQ